MKKSVLFFCFAFLMHNVFAQQNITWNGAANANWSVAANWLPAVVPGPFDTVILNSTNPCNVDIDPTIAAIRALGITSSNGLNNNTGAARTITISSNPVASTVLYVEAGSSFILDASPTSFGVSITTYGASGTNSAIVDGTMFIANTSSWSVSNGTASTNVVVSGTGTIHVPSAHTGTNVFVNSTSSNLHFLNGSKLNWSRNGGSVPGADYQDGSTITFTQVTNSMPVFNTLSNFNGLLIWNCGSQTISGASAVLLPTTSYSMDSIRVMNTGTGTLRIATDPLGYTLGHVEVQGGTLEMSTPLTAIRSATITTDLKITGGTVIGNATFAADAGGYPMTLNVNGNLIMTGGTLNLTNRFFALLPLQGAFILNVAGNISQTAGTITTTTAFGAQNQIVLNGTVPQTLTMSTFSGPMSLVLNNSSTNGITLSGGALTIPAAPAAMIFLSGVLRTTSANLLILSAGSQIFSVSDASFVDGPVRKFGNTAFVFPVGKSTGTFIGYVPVEISATTGVATDNFTAEYKHSTAQVYPLNNVGIDHVSNVDYWVLDRAGTTAAVNVIFYWTAVSSSNGSPNYISDLSKLIVAHCNGVNWDNFSGLGTTTGNSTSGSITWTNVPVFSPFSLASTTIDNPLPISVNYLNGYKQNGNHYLNWKVTCASSPNATMSLERSADARNFKEITTITADALRCQQPFDYTDIHPLAGMNYYRLKITDANGKITYSTIIALLNKETGFDIVGLLPTLVNSNALLNVTAAQKSKMELLITDVAGRQVQKISFNLIAGSNQFNLNLANLTAGTYQITGYTADGISRTIRFVKQ